MSKLPLPERKRPIYAPRSKAPVDVKAAADRAESPPKPKDATKATKAAADRAEKRRGYQAAHAAAVKASALPAKAESDDGAALSPREKASRAKALRDAKKAEQKAPNGKPDTKGAPKLKPAAAKAVKMLENGGKSARRLDPAGRAVQLNVRIPPPLMTKLQKRAKADKALPVEVVRAALVAYLG